MKEITFIKNKFLFYFFIFFLLEILSFFSWQLPNLKLIFFPILILFTLLLTWRNLNYGLLIASGELMVGSFGYLLNIDLFGQTISGRMIIWLVILIIWFKDFLINHRKINFFYQQNKKIILSAIILFIFLGISIGKGILKNNLNDVLLDSNAWLYLFLLFPWLMFTNKYVSDLWQIMMAAAAWLFIKTSLLLYLFSHNFLEINASLYEWTRDFRLGEITFAGGNFWRVFLQSQIFTLFLTLVLFYFVWYWYKKKDNKKQYLQIVVFNVLSLSVVLMSYSRSFWLGLLAGLILFIIYILYKKESWKNLFIINSNLLIIFILAISLIFFIVKFPWPVVDSSKTSLFISRLQNPTGEAASNSRLNQLQPLFGAIRQAPLLGSGFGTKVTYRSTDPRILSLGEDYAANYSTYAFEWGYLDIWLKLGLFGLFAYFLFIYQVIKRAVLFGNLLGIAFCFGFMAILITNLTTPYLNHPLGIGVIFWLIAISNKNDPT